MTNILTEIVSQKHKEVAAQKIARPLSQIISEINPSTPRRPFFKLFEQGPVLIGEIKPKSPSHGALSTDPLSVARIYAETEIDCISVLTDQKYFGGSIELLQQVRSLTPQTIFRKEFVVDVYQIYETAVAGADAVLLIASVLDDELLAACIQACTECNLGYLVEVHTADEVARAVRLGARVIGINNRNLDTLSIDLNVTETLAPLIPHNTPLVSESGIQTPTDVLHVKKAGARGILVGASLLKAPDVRTQVRELKEALNTK